MIAFGVIYGMVVNWYFTVPVILMCFFLLNYGYGEILTWVFVAYVLLFIFYMEKPWIAFLIVFGIQVLMLIHGVRKYPGMPGLDISGDEPKPGDPDFDIYYDEDNGSGYGGEDQSDPFDPDTF